MFSFKDLRRNESAADWRDIERQLLEVEIPAQEGLIAALQSQREEVIFGGDETALARLLRDIAAAEQELDLLRHALSGAIRRREAAEEAERTAELVSQLREATALFARLAEIEKKDATMATAIADARMEHTLASRRLYELRALATSHGRLDLFPADQLATQPLRFQTAIVEGAPRAAAGAPPHPITRLWPRPHQIGRF